MTDFVSFRSGDVQDSNQNGITVIEDPYSEINREYQKFGMMAAGKRIQNKQ